MNAVLTRVALYKIALLTCIATIGASSPAIAAKWDCVTNRTGVKVFVTLASHHNSLSFALAPNQSYPFKLNPDTKIVALVAFEYGTNNLITLTSFKTLPQNYPPTNCFPIKKTTSFEVETDRSAEEYGAEPEGGESL